MSQVRSQTDFAAARSVESPDFCDRTWLVSLEPASYHYVFCLTGLDIAQCNAILLNDMAITAPVGGQQNTGTSIP